MKNIKIKLPFLLNSNNYFGVVIFLIIIWAFSETAHNAKGFSWAVLLIGTLTILNGVANIFLEDINHSNIYKIKEESKILSSENITNYASLFLFLLVAKFWFTKYPVVGHVLFITLIFPLFIAICYVLVNEIKFMFTRGFSISGTLLGFAFLFYTLGNSLRHTISDAFGEEHIGSFFEKSDYTTKYYVNLFPGENNAKNYRLPADIHVYYEEQEGEEFSSSKKCIRVEKVYFPNGGFLRFTDDSDYDDLIFNKKVPLMDSHDRYWYIELIDEKVK